MDKRVPALANRRPIQTDWHLLHPTHPQYWSHGPGLSDHGLLIMGTHSDQLISVSAGIQTFFFKSI